MNSHEHQGPIERGMLTMPQRPGVEPRSGARGPRPESGTRVARAVAVKRSRSWWGDVEIDGSCHFGPVAYIEFVDGTATRYQALTVRELNAAIAPLGIEVDCPADLLDQPECVCSACHPRAAHTSAASALSVA